MTHPAVLSEIVQILDVDPAVQILLNSAKVNDASFLNWIGVAMWANDPNLAEFALACAAERKQWAAEERQEAKRLMEVGA